MVEAFAHVFSEKKRIESSIDDRIEPGEPSAHESGKGAHRSFDPDVVTTFGGDCGAEFGGHQADRDAPKERRDEDQDDSERDAGVLEKWFEAVGSATDQAKNSECEWQRGDLSMVFGNGLQRSVKNRKVRLKIVFDFVL